MKILQNGEPLDTNWKQVWTYVMFGAFGFLLGALVF
jgi:hypothetical protein